MQALAMNITPVFKIHLDRVYAQKEEETGAEIIRLQMDTIPPTNIFGVYLETGKSAEKNSVDAFISL